MFSVITRFSILIVLAFIAGLIALSSYGPIIGIAVGIAVLAIPLIYSYINLANLLKYTLDDSIETMRYQVVIGRMYFHDFSAWYVI